MKQTVKLLLAICFLLSTFSAAQQKEKFTINNKEADITTEKIGNRLYISISEFASRFNFQSYKNIEKNKIEFRLDKFSITVTSNNPFVVIRDKETSSPVTYQLSNPTIERRKDIFIPFNSFSSLLLSKTGKKLKSAAEKLNAEEKEVEPKHEEEKKETEDKKPSTPVEVTSSFISYSISERVNGTLITLSSKYKIDKYTSSFKNSEIAILFNRPNDVALPEGYTSTAGVIKGIHWNKSNKKAEIGIKVNSDYSSHEIFQENEHKLIVTIHNKKFAKSKPTDAQKQKWKFDVIVLDAGHGGKDYGAIGIHNTIEKQINLAVTLKVGKLITQNLKEVKVVYTRKDDTFIELYKRGKIANENNGKLFISVHCNSVAAKSSVPNGYEIYLLRPGRTQEAITIAERENSVISYEEKPARYEKLTDENFILVSMAHSSYMRYSEKFAEIMDNHLRNSDKIISRGIKQAGFYVLVGAAMPSILFETGYVTNEKDSEYMKSEEGQNSIANAIFQAIKSFKTYYSKEIETE